MCKRNTTYACCQAASWQMKWLLSKGGPSPDLPQPLLAECSKPRQHLILLLLGLLECIFLLSAACLCIPL